MVGVGFTYLSKVEKAKLDFGVYPSEELIRKLATLKRLDQFCSVDQRIYGHLTPRNLAVLAEESSDRVEAQRLWNMVLDACPGDPEAISRGEA